MTWRNPSWAEVPEWLRPTFSSLEEFMAAPTFLAVQAEDANGAVTALSLNPAGGAVKINDKTLVFGANDSAGAGYRTIKIENA